MNIDTSPAACCVSLTAASVSSDQANATASLFKALSDPHRVQIINLLSNSSEPVCVCDITAALDVSQATASHHLKKLTDAGLLNREARGTWAYYSIDPSALDSLRQAVGGKI